MKNKSLKVGMYFSDQYGNLKILISKSILMKQFAALILMLLVWFGICGFIGTLLAKFTDMEAEVILLLIVMLFIGLPCALIVIFT